MALSTRARTLTDRLRGSWRILAKEITAFGAVGVVALIIDFSVFNAFLSVGNVKAQVISGLVSTTFAYLGNRFLSFSHRARIGVARETVYFFGINLITIAFSAVVVGIFSYPLGFNDDRFVINLVKLVTIALGTMFRFWSYKRFVFLHPDRVHHADVDLDEELAEP